MVRLSMETAPIYKNRTYECSIHAGHIEDDTTEETGIDFGSIVSIITEWAEAYEDGVIEYAALCLEESRGQRTHVQGFVTFAPEAYQQESAYRVTKSGKDKFTPSNLLRGSWRLVRSISGAQNYVVRSGIHAGKSGLLYQPFEFGTFVDPAWNTSLRTRILYEISTRIEDGFSVEDLRSVFPLKMALIGEHAIEALVKGRNRHPSWRAYCLKPYCYIGREQLEIEMEILGKTDRFSASKN